MKKLLTNLHQTDSVLNTTDNIKNYPLSSGSHQCYQNQVNLKRSEITGQINMKLSEKKLNLKKNDWNILQVHAVFCFIWFLGLLIFAIFYFERLMLILGLIFSQDGNITYKKVAFLTVFLTPPILLISLLWVLDYKKRKISIRYWPQYIILFCAHISIFISFDQLIEPQTEDGILEMATVLLSFLASFLFLISGIFSCAFAFLLSFFWMVFALEEISWGQRFFNFQSPAIFENQNFQGETNFHNFFNPYFTLIYITLNFIIFSFFTIFTQLKVFIVFYKIPSILFVAEVGAKYSIWIIPLFLMGVTIVPGGLEFVEQGWSVLGVFLASFLLIERFKTP